MSDPTPAFPPDHAVTAARRIDGPAADPARVAPTRDSVRRSIADQLLESLDRLVTRHRALALHDEHIELHAELIAAEVAHQLAMTRSALRRHPSVRRAS